MRKEKRDDEAKNHQPAPNPDNPDPRVFCHLKAGILPGGLRFEADGELFAHLLLNFRHTLYDPEDTRFLVGSQQSHLNTFSERVDLGGIREYTEEGVHFRNLNRIPFLSLQKRFLLFVLLLNPQA